MESCKYCKKQIEKGNQLSHESYCYNNMIKCDICDNLYNKAEKEQHNQEFHRLSICLYCKSPIYNLSSHICKERVVQCKYCQIEFPLTQFSEHEDYCGSRTEVCDYCKKYIKKVDRIYHQRICPPQNIDQVKQQDEQKKYNNKIENVQKQEMNSRQFNQVSNKNQDYYYREDFPNQNNIKEAQPKLSGYPTQNLFESKPKSITIKEIDQQSKYSNNLLQNQQIDQIQDNKKYSSLSMGPYPNQNQIPDNYQYSSKSQINTFQNPASQYQFQQNQNINQNLNIIQERYDISDFSSLTSSQNSNKIQQQFGQDFQFNQNQKQGNVVNQSGQQQKNQFQILNQDKPMELEYQQQVNQGYLREEISNIDKQNYNDSIIGRILYESIQADILRMNYEEYKEQQKKQQILEQEQEQKRNLKKFKQNESPNQVNEFDYLSDEDRLIQILRFQEYEQQRNQRRQQ